MGEGLKRILHGANGVRITEALLLRSWVAYSVSVQGHVAGMYALFLAGGERESGTDGELVLAAVPISRPALADAGAEPGLAKTRQRGEPDNDRWG